MDKKINYNRVLFISRRPDKNTGGYKVITRNLQMIKLLYGNKNIDVIEIPIPTLIVRFINILFCQSYGMTKSIKTKITHHLNTYNYSLCFIDSSVFGGIAQLISKMQIPTLIFCHNVEVKYFIDKYKISRNPLDLLMKRYIYNQEGKSIKNGTYILTINDRDSMGMKELYGREADFILPTSFTSHIGNTIKDFDPKNPYCLFVGSNFYANQEGIVWFIENILPSIKFDLWIIGSICDYIKNKYKKNLSNKIHLYGIVDNLDSYYRGASCIIAPIFSGSGLKTKTIEALSYGKSIISTNEGWEGIKVIPEELDCYRCNNKEEFIFAFSTIPATSGINYKVKEFFNSNFSDEFIKDKFSKFLISNSLL